MKTEVAEIGPDIFRLSTYIAEADFMFNQFLLRDDEPALFHTGPGPSSHWSATRSRS